MDSHRQAGQRIETLDTMNNPRQSGVQFPGTASRPPSASDALCAILAAAAARFPNAFTSLAIPEAGPRLWTRRRLAELVMRFEVSRGAAIERVEIARCIADRVQETFEFHEDGRVVSLQDAFGRRSSALPIVEISPEQLLGGGTAAGDRSDRLHSMADIDAEVARLAADELISDEAIAALRRAHETVAGTGHGRLRGEKFVLLGGTAELSPLSHLLRDGAEVLTTDSSLASLQRRLHDDGLEGYSGRLFRIRDGVDLLKNPVEFTESILEYATDQSVHVVALAYKGGEGREWRLAAAMDGIVRRLMTGKRLKSSAYYRSPSSITEVSERTAMTSQRRLESEGSAATRGISALTADTLYRPNIVGAAGTWWTRSLVPEQGASYAAANLFGKTYAAEVQVADARGAGAPALRVSANVAPITATGSTDTPATRALFPYLRPLGVEVFPARLAQRLMYLLLLADLFGDVTPGPIAFPKQVHGGVFTNPWALNSVFKEAYLKALLRWPRRS